MPASASSSPATPGPTNAPPQPVWSMARPISGEPIADPPVRAEPCQPIASPRTRSGTARLRSSTVAVRVGAQKSPVTKSRAAKPKRSPANETGMLVTESSRSSTNAEGCTFIESYAGDVAARDVDPAEYDALIAERGITVIPKAHLTPDGGAGA